MAAVHMVFTWSQFGLRLTTDPNILTKHNRKHWLTGSVSASPARELNLTRLGLLCVFIISPTSSPLHILITPTVREN